MQLKSDSESFSLLYNTIVLYYSDKGDRPIKMFEVKEPSDRPEDGYYIRYLLDRKHVLEYGVGFDRGVFLASPALAIGPSFFAPGDFWDFENSERFSWNATTEAVVYNLELMDEFLGYARNWYLKR